MQSPAAVISSNIIGYIKLSLQPGFSLVANQLDDGNANILSEIMPSFPTNGVVAAAISGTNWITSTNIDGFWSPTDFVLSLGGGLRIFNPGDQDLAETLVGEIPEGVLKHFIPAGRSIRSSFIPRDGRITSDLDFPLVAGVKLFTIETNGIETLLAACDGIVWSPAEPNLRVAEAVIVDSPSEFIWEQEFTELRLHPLVTQQTPQHLIVHDGEPFTLSVAVATTERVRYRWQLNGDGIPAATESTYTVAAASQADAGRYWAIASIGGSYTWSELVTVEVVAAEVPALTMSSGTDGQLTLRATASPGGLLTVESTTDLRSWSTYASVTNTSGTVTLSIPASETHQMFRVTRN